MKKFIKILCVILSICCITCISASCKAKQEFTYWETNAKASGEARLTYVSNLSFNSSNTKIAGVWINVSDLGTSKVEIKVTLKRYSTDKKVINYELTKEAIKSSEDGWLRIYEGVEVECSEAIVEVIDTLRFNEIYFTDGNNKHVDVGFDKGGIRAGKNNEIILSKTELQNLTEENLAYSKNPAYNIIDEQDKFPKEKLNK